MNNSGLINKIDKILNYYFYNKQYNSSKRSINLFIKEIKSKIYLEEINNQIDYTKKIPEFLDKIKTTIRSDSFDSVLSLLECLVDNLYIIWGLNLECDLIEKEKNKVIENLNEIFENEFIGYRFINGQITPITDEIEIEAIKNSSQIDFDPVKTHFDKSLQHLSDRNKPDYENSIKESILAIESICCIILGEEKTTLGKALDKLEKNGIIIHKAMKEAFKKLYGYASDANGIRHANGIGNSYSTLEEAKFMLVSCSAFANYLNSVAEKAIKVSKK